MTDKQTSTTIVGKTPKKNLKYQRDKDREKVRGIFTFHEVPGGTMKFRIKLYKEDDVEVFCLKDGETYELPLGVAKHLNKNGWYPVHEHTMSAGGKSVYKVGQKKRRFGFSSLEFIDPEDFATVDPQIITVEKI